MSAFQDLAAPAPQVESAVAERAEGGSAPLVVEPAKPSEEAVVDKASAAGPAVPFDHPDHFAPPMTPEVASRLSVAALKEGSGADFESQAAVIKGGVQRNFFRRALPFIYDERDFVAMGEVLRFVFIKGNCMFVYCDETDPSPLYAVQLETLRAIQEDPKNPDKDAYTVSPRVNTNEARANLVTVLLKDRKTNKQEYQLTFDTTKDRSTAKRFMDVLARNAKFYGNEVVTASVVCTKGP